MESEFIIGVGGHKCASTWISEFLRYHPDVFVTDPKEIHYFTKFYGKGSAWYESHFIGKKRIQCEFSSDYLYRSEACERIKKHFGNDIKIVISIRNPVDRAVSHIKHICRDNGFSVSQIDREALVELIEKNPDICNFSKFYEGIKRFRNSFGADNVLILSKDSLDTNCLLEVRRLCDFAGVPFSDTNRLVNKRESIGINPRSKYLELLRQKIYHICYKNFPIGISFVKRIGLSRLYRRLNSGSAIIFTDEALNHLNNLFSDDWSNVRSLLDDCS